jgi:adenylate cyclase
MAGDIDRALAEGQRSLALAKDLRHSVSLVHGLDYLALLSQYMGDPKAVIRYADEAIKLARELGLPAYIATSTIFRAWALAQLGEPEGRVDEIRKALATKNIIISVATDRFHRALLAELHAQAGDHAGALAAIDEALADLGPSGMRQWESELHRLKGESLLAETPRDLEAAVRHFETALTVAAGQKAGSLELRAATSLARAWSRTGRRAEGRALLAARRVRILGGGASADVSAADALLRELA